MLYNCTMDVSVIIPAHNAEHTIQKLLDSLESQAYQRNRYEVIVVDNGSSDATKQIVQEYETVTLLEENNIQSSYAARNKGIRASCGEVLLFTDADCIVDSNWIEQMLEKFRTSQASVVAGNVLFTFSKKCSAAEQWDSLTHLNNKSSVKKGYAKTANVGVRREVFGRVGFFPEVSSGGDVSWTSLAVQNGEQLVFSSSAIVYHPARTYTELMSKYVRVGGGSIQAWRNMKRSWAWIICASFSLPLPLVYSDVVRYIKERGREDVRYKPYKMMAVAYMGRLHAFWGITRSVFNRKG